MAYPEYGFFDMSFTDVILNSYGMVLSRDYLVWSPGFQRNVAMMAIEVATKTNVLTDSLSVGSKKVEVFRRSIVDDQGSRQFKRSTLLIDFNNPDEFEFIIGVFGQLKDLETPAQRLGVPAFLDMLSTPRKTKIV